MGNTQAKQQSVPSEQTQKHVTSDDDVGANALSQYELDMDVADALRPELTSQYELKELRFPIRRETSQYELKDMRFPPRDDVASIYEVKDLRFPVLRLPSAYSLRELQFPPRRTLSDYELHHLNQLQWEEEMKTARLLIDSDSKDATQRSEIPQNPLERRDSTETAIELAA